MTAKAAACLVRPARPKDLERILVIDQYRGPGAWTADAYRGFLQDLSGTLALVICPDHNPDLVLGFALARFLVDELEILQIVVEEAWRGRGLGRMLMTALAKKGREAGKGSWILEVRENNLPALRLYQALGFEEIGRRPGYYPDSGESAILMQADLISLGTNDKKGSSCPD
ncbi:MAG TPA: ribosomal protein S18-alanine N-acetyltransferase [Clostridia bacterium]|nr:ribosomal protein S18-alanine N-acetyltransferase [Clostridia bacterium]